MSRINKIILSIILMALVVFGVNIESNAAWKVGSKIKLGYQDYWENSGKPYFCVEKGEKLRSKEINYKIVDHITIKGKTSTSEAKKNNVTSESNAVIAYIGASSAKMENRQKAIWDYFDTWVENVGKKHGSIGSSFVNNKNLTDPTVEKNAKEYAKNYVEDAKITDKTNKESISTEIVTKDNKNYYKVGPFTYDVTGSIDSDFTFKVLNDSNKEISGVLYASYSGSEIKFTTDIKSLVTNGKNIYLYIPEGSMTQELNLKISFKQNVKTASLWLFKAGTNAWQNLIYITGKTTTETISGNYKYELVAEGNLEIIKKNDDGEVLEGIGFKVKSESGTNQGKYVVRDSDGKITFNETGTEFVTGKDGKITIEKLPSGTYSLEETKVSDEYEKLSVSEIGDVIINSNKTTYKTVINKYRPGTLKVIKIDANDEEIRIPRVKFKIKAIDGTNNGKYVVRNNNGDISYTDDINSATEFVTAEVEGNNVQGEKEEVGTFVVSGLQSGNYSVKETEAAQNYILKEDETTVKVDPGKVTTVVVPNTPKYINISGMVWKDLKPGDKANTAINHKYDDGQDALISNVEDKVIARLVDKSGNTVKNIYGKECIAEVKDGTYRFESVLISNLDEYNVIFTYNGFQYKDVNVDYNVKNENTSKAAEAEAARTQLNESFKNVTGDSETTGKTQNHSIEYTRTDENGSKIARLTKIDGADAKGRNYSNNIALTAITQDSYIKNRYNELSNNGSEAIDEVTFINLGLYEREMPDLSVKQVLSNVKLTINGYEHTYFYKTKVENGEDIYKEGFNVGVRYGKILTESYRRAIYTADWNTFSDKNKQDRLQVYMTYSIALENDSTGLDAEFNSIVDYYDSRYDIEKVGTKIDSQTGEITDSINFTEGSSYNNLYKKTTIDLSGMETKAGKNSVIFIQFKLNDEVTLEKLNGQGGLKNVTEINGYTIKENGKAYAGIDSDSNPGNEKPEDVVSSTAIHEDDICSAPDLVLEVNGKRELSGTVFEDEAKVDDENYLEGNGLYDSGEKGIKDVKVELKDKNGKVEVETKTDENGNYTISGFTPGEYTVVYTWGDGTYKVADYKNTIFNEATHKTENRWWINSSEDSDAKDNYETRTRIDNGENIDKMESTTPKMSFAIENGGTQITSTKATSDGDEFNAEGFSAGNINFGIVRRPEINLNIAKRISKYKLTLQDGRVESDITITYNNEKNEYTLTGTKDHLIYLPVDTTYKSGILRQEIDNEFLDGATLEVEYEIVVSNNSNKDYQNSNFYYYGKASKDFTNPVTITPTHVTDYLDKEFNYNPDKENVDGKNSDTWKQIEYNEQEFDSIVKTTTTPAGDWEKYGQEYTLEDGSIAQAYRRSLGSTETSTESSKEYLYRYQRTMTDTTLQEKYSGERVELNNIGELKAGESITKHIAVSRLIDGSSDLTFDNESEITEYKVTSGRMSNITYYNADDNAEKVIITPPNGEDRDYIMVTIFAISMIVIIGVGVVFIKKKVLKS